MNQIKVTGSIVSKTGVTLFLDDGTSKVLPSDSFQTQSILDAVMPKLARMEHATIDLDVFVLTKIIEKATGGAIRVQDNGDGLKVGMIGSADIDDANGALRKHVEDAAQGGAKGFKAFMRMFAEMNKLRKHSAVELLAFMKGADLPIADDGSLIGYKVLRRVGNDLADKHSGRVRQRLGSLVYMPASKVSDNRREACGVGLHIAARSYLNRFYDGNDALCLVKIKPFDVISVPTGEQSKMRVCAYHVVGIIDSEDAAAIVGGAYIGDREKAAKLLENIIAGNHPPINQKVAIGVTDETKAYDKRYGEVTVTDLGPKVRERKTRKTRPLRRALKVSVAGVKRLIAASQPFEKKLPKAQRDYDNGMSIRDIAIKWGMDRETLGKKLDR